MKSIQALFLVLVMLLPVAVQSQEIEYTPGGSKYELVWERFYKGDHEPQLDDPLIKAGSSMTLFICEAINNKDMKLRRYAIGALGYIGDRRALSMLENILKTKSELEYFRGDALRAIYQIDRNLGKEYAVIFINENKYLNDLSKSIKKDEKWLTEPTVH